MLFPDGRVRDPAAFKAEVILVDLVFFEFLDDLGPEFGTNDSLHSGWNCRDSCAISQPGELKNSPLASEIGLIMETQNKQPFDVQKLMDTLLNIKSFSELTKPNGILQEIRKGTTERMLKAERDKYRNGTSKKSVKSSPGTAEISVRRNRNGTF